MKICRLCGNTKNLVPDGEQWRCEWEHGCEHRRFVHDETMKRLSEELAKNDPVESEPYTCGHTYEDHVQMMGAPMADLFDVTWQDMKRLMGDNG